MFVIVCLLEEDVCLYVPVLCHVLLKYTHIIQIEFSRLFDELIKSYNHQSRDQSTLQLYCSIN